jgi:hypothetical protein
MISNIYPESSLHNSPALESQSRIILYKRLLPILSSIASAFQGGNGSDVHDLLNATTMDFIICSLFGLKNGSNFLQNETGGSGLLVVVAGCVLGVILLCMVSYTSTIDA